jgi:branched-chain amino acid transport system permease protein
MDNLLQQTVNAIALGAIYSLFALGYALVFSVLGVLNLAHSSLFMWGAFIGLIATDVWSLPLWLAFPLAMVGAGVLGVILEFVAFRPLRRRNAARIAQLISSIGAALLLINIAQLIFLEIYSRTEGYFPAGLIPNETIVVEELALRISPVRLATVVVALVLMIALQYLVNRTRIGQQMRAVAYDQRIASLLGINVGRVFWVTFFLAGALGGAAGMFYGLVFNTIDPFIGQDIALLGLTAIVLGGLGNVPGAVAGGFIVAAIQTYSTAAGGSSYRDAIVFALLFVILLVRPQGLLGQAESTRA